ncbi:MAG TPA: pilus assembly protein TadG-related protein [Nocardioidaceae bacterium]|nr:pilus assembly protein TadG-related protein [Nocardioidaceae bacterium]
MSRRDQAGQTTVLIVGLALVALLMVAVVVDASAAYLRRQGLDSLADGAALAAADGVQGAQVYQGGLGDHARIDPDAARAYAADYLETMGAASRYPGFSYTVRTEADRVVVHVAAPLVLPIIPPGWVRRPVISGTAASIVGIED